MRLLSAMLGFLSSGLFLGLVLLVCAALWWFGLFWFLETVLGWDPKAAALVGLSIRGVGAVGLGVWGLFLVIKDLTD